MYDFLFFWPHLLMHSLPRLYRGLGHYVHHTNSPLGVGEVLRHSFLDGALQVITSALSLNLCRVPTISRFVHNVFITYLLTELHSGYDCPWMLHNVVPFGLLAGPPLHEWHHTTGGAPYQQFFTYISWGAARYPAYNDFNQLYLYLSTDTCASNADASDISPW
eukprot:g21636.t1